MVEMELVKMSPKGQLVVPKEIRQLEKFKPSDRFVPFHVKGGILFKRVKMPNVKAEFTSLAKEIEKKFKEKRVTKKDVDGAVKWARKR
ncbi:hypothetical protein CMO93_04980 [Candidatus Woesearchaeota archaeon]|nr:hypothetical protein [Candidatus Woesearchaeota archaeon]|tara:strand:- start:3642 stop:3905 length:264 start_codon:yes stop_codon:yes gene_type:complete